jgi:hypothetical protein
MSEKRYEYRLVVGYHTSSHSQGTSESALNKLAREGFRVIACAGDGFRVPLCWTLEREVPPATPYRG